MKEENSLLPCSWCVEGIARLESRKNEASGKIEYYVESPCGMRTKYEPTKEGAVANWTEICNAKQ